MNTSIKLPPILYVDDEEDNLVVFNSTFRRDYEVHSAKSGVEGLYILKKYPIQLIITDQRMPEMTGIQFLERVIPEYPDCIRMILTGFSDSEAIIQAINTGRVYRYITKPWNREELKIDIDKGLETYQLRKQNKELIEDLREANQTLEQKVIERTNKIESQNLEIISNIHYARKIQIALLPAESELRRSFPDHFILSIPKDIVSGDYYWLARKQNKVFVAVADCTGHGVHGAFMSILGITLLNEIVNKTNIIHSDEILNQLSKQVVRSLHQTGHNNMLKDGMDIALCVIDLVKLELQYSGAFRPLYIIQNNELKEYKGDSMPVGISEDEEMTFSHTEIPLARRDILYLFSDGYTDQIGGANRKTLKSGNFKKLLTGISKQSMDKQKEYLEMKFREWKGDMEQIDDILVLGIKI